MTGYRLVRSRRKTLAILVTPDAQVEIRAPMHVSQSTVGRFFRSREPWIRERLEQVKKQQAEIKTWKDRILFLGRECRVATIPESRFWFNGLTFHVPEGLGEKEGRRRVVRMFRKLARDVLEQRLRFFSGQLGAEPAGLRITGARTRWGSCSVRKALSFSWRLVMSDPDLVDYVAVHELVHLKHYNHSGNFWETVERILPDYKIRRKRLKAFLLHPGYLAWLDD